MWGMLRREHSVGNNIYWSNILGALYKENYCYDGNIIKETLYKEHL
jgi:hypothetical protein